MSDPSPVRHPSAPAAPRQAGAHSAAEAAVAALEQLELGAAFAPLVAAALAAVGALRDAARAVVFPVEVRPAPSDAIAMLEFYAKRWPSGQARGPAAAALHARSITAHPALAALVRSPEILADVGAAAATLAASTAQDPVELATAAREAFELAVAHQLVAAGHELAPAAADLLAADALAARLVAARARHEEHAAAELRRVEEERKAAEEACAREAGRRAVEAAEEGVQLEKAAGQARERARQLRAENLEKRLRESKRKDLRAGRELFGVADLLRAVRGFSMEQIQRLEAALDRVGA